MDATIRRVICPCGNDTYYRTRRSPIDSHTEGGRVWKCCNCGALTRRTVRRMSDATIAKKAAARVVT